MSKNNGSVFSQDKIFQHGNKLEQYLEIGKTSAPVTMEIDLTNRCNNRCPSCTGYNEDNIQMDASLAERIIFDMADIGVGGLIFTGGGEPLLHPEMSYLVEYANMNGLDVGVITSGQAPPKFDKEDLDRIIKNSKWLRVSLDAGSPERYMNMHGLSKDKYNKAVKFITDASDRRDILNKNLTVGVGYLTGKGDAREEYLDFSRAAVISAYAGADYFQLRPLHGSKRVANFDNKTRNRISVINPEMRLLTSDHKYKWMGDDGDRTYDYCHGTRFASVVTADGKLNLCCHFRNQDIGQVADLTKTSLVDVWDSDMIEHATSNIDVHKCIPYCRCDNINRSIEQLIGGKKNEHKNFL